MAHGTVGFFESSCPFSVNGWDLQNTGGRSSSSDYVNDLGSDGNEIRKATTNRRTSWSWDFVLAESVSVGTSIPLMDVGIVVTGNWHVDQITVRWDRSQIAPKMTVTGHKHDDGTPHPVTSTSTTGKLRYYKASVDIKAVAFGVPADLGAVSLATGAVVDFRDATYTLSVSHTDETGRTGQELAGNNYDGVETMAVNFTGDFTDDDIEIADGWTKTENATKPSNTGATTSSLNLVHHVAHYTPTSD